MDLSVVKDTIIKNYNLSVTNVEKVKNTFKVEADEGRYGLKVIKYQYSHFLFIISVIKHLQRSGFEGIPEMINTKNGESYIVFNDKFAYLTPWIESRNSSYSNEEELDKVVEKLAELHLCSKNFSLTNDMKPRIGWFSWIKVFETRCDEVLDFKKRIYQKAYLSDYDKLYLKNIDNELERGYKAIKELKEAGYYEIMSKQVRGRGVCHHDYAHHNVLIDGSNNIYVIDFDYTILDSNLHDIASILIRSMKDGKWDVNKGKRIIKGYSNINEITDDEIMLMKGFIRFPQMFWQRGLQYYWEQQPWDEEFMINRLNKYICDIDGRERFIEEFFEKGGIL